MDYAATRDAPAGETAHLLPPSASGSEWIGGNTRGAAVAAFCLATLALASTASRGARGAATALGDSARLSVSSATTSAPASSASSPSSPPPASARAAWISSGACPYIDPRSRRGEYSVVANCLAGGPGCQENNMCRTCAVVESSDYPKCPYVVCLNFGLDPSTCDPNPGGESSELAAAETEPQAVETETEPQAVETETEPQAVETETEPQAVETETEPQAVETETEPQAVETETEPQAVETDRTPSGGGGHVDRRERPFRRPRFHRNRRFRRFRIRGVGPSHLRFDDVHGIQVRHRASPLGQIPSHWFLVHPHARRW